MKQALKLFVVAALGLFVTVALHAQVTTSSLSGKITDAKGPVAGAAIVAVYTPNGAQYWALSDENGNYRINSIIPGGPYTVTVEMLGYHSSKENGLYAPLGETAIYNFEMVEDAIALDAAVLVADSNESGMNIRRSGAGTTISLQRMESVPTVSRSMNDVMKLTP